MCKFASTKIPYLTIKLEGKKVPLIHLLTKWELVSLDSLKAE